ncbi:MAG: helicase-related protein, partial [Patescibacteria group bacterium]|nr:helicase-related protein [Patescibacteria group bacterium]
LLKEIINRHQRHERTLITTLTKKTAEALTDYLNQHTQDLKIKVQYLHADVHTLDRSDILADLRKGVYDVLVGINLLREGLDLPEVSLVAILDADKAGFLRSTTSLIQTMGRAARHINGEIYLYADQTTDSMRLAIKEVSRRRRIQLNYNRKNKISPRSINKPFRRELINRLKPDLPWEIDPRQMTPLDKQTAIRSLTRRMNQAAKNMDFETAALLRDQIIKLTEN